MKFCSLTGYDFVMAGTEVRVTILAVDPPIDSCGPGIPVVVGVQHRKEIEQVQDVVGTLSFEVSVNRYEDGDVRGPYVHGKRGDRFLYLVWGVGTGAEDFERFGRTKLLFDDVPADIWTGDLRCDFDATNQKGRPSLASVRPPRVRWTSTAADGKSG